MTHQDEHAEVVLPAIDTPVGAAQRLRIFVPTPESLFTVGAIGASDMRQKPAGPGGFSFRTVEHLAAEIHKNTIFDTDLNTTIHTGETFTGVAGKKLELSTNGDAQMGAVGGINITASPASGFVDPGLTVEPTMDVPPPPAIDTESERSASETDLHIWKAIWMGLDAYKGAKSLKDFAKKRKLSKGVGKETKIAKASGVYGLYSSAKSVYKAGVEVYNAMVEAVPSHEIPERPHGAGRPKVLIHATDGIGLTTPSKISGYATEGVSFISPWDVNMKAGVSASLKSMVSTTVFSVASSKLESMGLAVVKGKITSIMGDKSELIGKEIAAISSEKLVSVTSDDAMIISPKAKLDISSAETWVNGTSYATVRSEEKLELESLQTTLITGKDKVTVESDTQIFMAVKNSDIQITDGKINLGIGSFIATIDSSSFVCGNTNIKKSEATMKGTIRLG